MTMDWRYEPLPDGQSIAGSEHRIIVFTLPHSKTSKGYNVDPAPIGRHRNPLRCPVSWLAMFAFIKFWVLGHGMPELLEGSENYFQDRVSR